MNRLRATLATVLLLFAITAQATTTLESFKFGDHASEQRFRDLISEVRCLVCQNQSLADSDADLAHDLRAEIYAMMQDGKSNEEIIAFLVARYGDFVLYKPPVKPSTYLIWYGPFALMLFAVFLVHRVLRRRRQISEPELTPEEQQRLAKILEQTGIDREGRA
jgi:cytochrome c-type biogenesis protein CcmH